MIAQHLRAYVERTHGLADALTSDATRRARVLGCEPTAANCLRMFIARFGKLSYRRPLDTKEIDSLVTRATAEEREPGAEACGGGPVGRPTPVRKRRTLSGAFTKARSFILPPQRWQSRTSI